MSPAAPGTIAHLPVCRSRHCPALTGLLAASAPWERDTCLNSTLIGRRRPGAGQGWPPSGSRGETRPCAVQITAVHRAPFLPGSLLVPTLGGMRWMSSDGTWVVELVRRTASSNGRDGEWLRVLHHGLRWERLAGWCCPPGRG